MLRSRKKNTGLSLTELIIVIAIAFVIMVGTTSIFLNFRNQQALGKDTEIVVSVLRQARNQTVTSRNAFQYGVHFATSKVTLFVGNSYDSATSTNQDFMLTSPDTIMTISLTGGGNDVVFQRLSGETNQNGTVTLRSSATSNTKIVTIYKTGIVESN